MDIIKDLYHEYFFDINIITEEIDYYTLINKNIENNTDTNLSNKLKLLIKYIDLNNIILEKFFDIYIKKFIINTTYIPINENYDKSSLLYMYEILTHNFNKIKFRKELQTLNYYDIINNIIINDPLISNEYKLDILILVKEYLDKYINMVLFNNNEKSIMINYTKLII